MFHVDKKEFYNLKQKELSRKNIIFEYRLKNSLSFVAKLQRHLEYNCFFSKVYNDIIGTRMIIDTNIYLNQMKIYIEDKLSDVDGIRIINGSKAVGYNAIHIYIKHKSLLPVELQIWGKQDVSTNHICHYIYKQDHFRKEHHE